MKVSTFIFLLFILVINSTSADIQQAVYAPGNTTDPVIQMIKDFPLERITKTSADTNNINLRQDGSFGSTENLLIGSIATFTVDNQNRVFIADAQQKTIQVFSSDGRHITSMGREGSGPGEFTLFTTNSMMDIHSNRLYVSDLVTIHQLFRLQVFNLNDLSFDRTIKMVPQNSNDYEQLKAKVPHRFFPRNNGTFLVAYQLTPDLQRDDKGYIHYVVQDDDGKILAEPLLKQMAPAYLTGVVRGRALYTALQTFPFYEKSLLVISEDGHLYAANHTSEFNITIYDSEGNYISSFRKPFSNRPLSRDTLIDRYNDKMTYLGPGNVAANMIRNAQNLPDTWPAMNDLLIDDKNRLWISTIVGNDEIYEWWILEESGELIARFDWPRNKHIKVIKNNKVYTLETNKETGLEKIVRYHIEMSN